VNLVSEYGLRAMQPILEGIHVAVANGDDEAVSKLDRILRAIETVLGISGTTDRGW
jgi:D-aminopeptidase